MNENVNNNQYIDDEETIDLVELFFAWLKHINFVITSTFLTALCI